MIYVHSRPTDTTTITFTEWLLDNEIEFKRVHSALDYVKNMSCGIGTNNLKFNFQSIYSHGGSMDFEIPIIDEDDKLNQNISRHLSNEYKNLVTYLLQSIENNDQVNIFGNLGKPIYSKLQVLELAIEIGFNIPPSAIITSKADLKLYMQLWGEIILKSIENGIKADGDKFIILGQRTEFLNIKDLKIDDIFLPTLIQKNIQKEFEIKTCYFNKKHYSMAIFSQMSEETKYDSRHFNPYKPIRMIPYTLPFEIKNKIEKLMCKLNYNYGTIDLIYDTEGNYIFLEVNPFGQYGTISEIGNYKIEKIILEYLQRK